ncbi:MAG: response regulator transcription factor [Alicyclobacillus herbarius]|uniref:response regulator n=1 Tax=Alicyclobacillus herbarius TaxID=122960 RepID=UPI0005549748|nr:response regulator transcription factor [Alicyclobacillus herbarius]MCL6631738.1 response regulator transcription factor [Alicyclobacillus herbarius]
MGHPDTKSLRVLIVDDHTLFRKGVQSIISHMEDVQSVLEAENGEVAMKMVAEQQPDVVLMDINMPVCDGLEATRRIKADYPSVRILMLTVSEAESMLFEAIKSGADGYVLKTASPDSLMDAVLRVSRGEPVVPANLAMRIITEMSAPAKHSSHSAEERAAGGPNGVDRLTDREMEVLRHLSTGASNREIAAALYISENTVRNHIRSILEKLHLANRVQAAAYAVREGYVLKSDET